MIHCVLQLVKLLPHICVMFSGRINNTKFKMSLRNLVEDQCGTANSLVQLSSHFVQDRALNDQGLLHPFQHENFPPENEQVKNRSILLFIC